MPGSGPLAAAYPPGRGSVDTMVVLLALLLALIPAIAVSYPFLLRSARTAPSEDDSSPQAETSRRWEAAVAGLMNAELERGIGSLAEEDYRWLRQQYLTEAALALKTMELEDGRAQRMQGVVELVVQRTRPGGSRDDPADRPVACPSCGAPSESEAAVCLECGESVAPITPDGPSRVDAPDETAGE